MDKKKILFKKNIEGYDDYLICSENKSSDIICKTWELSNHIQDVSHIHCEYILEYLTNFEADRTLRDWLKCLKTNGTITLILTNMNFYMKKWLDAEWDEDTIKDDKSLAKSSFNNIWGKQQNCDPWDKFYNNYYEDVKKSGYNEKRIYFLLSRMNYSNIKIVEREEGTLYITANKPLGGGERQDATSLEEIREDHIQRYKFASSLIKKSNSKIVDAACGVAYGSYILAQNKNIQKVQSFDISKEALEHGKKYFFNKKIEYINANLEKDKLDINNTDYFISFETIEHLPFPEKYIKKISENLKKGSFFIGSTPNEKIMPYTKYFSYHTKHFYEKELERILEKNGFVDIEFFQQKREFPSNIEKIENGEYIIFIAKKD